MRFSVLVALTLAVGFAARAQDGEIAAHFAKFNSPDKRFAVRATEEDGMVSRIEVIEVANGRSVADLSEDIMLSETQSVEVLWAKDSKKFAVNFRAGGRYETTSFHRWEKDGFFAMGSPEEVLYDTIVLPARKRELESAGKPADTYLRRIWDDWRTVKWIDANTVEIHGDSTAAYYVDDEPIDIAVGINATVKFDAKGKPEILKAVEVPAKD
jgi:hypothetical protein